jgi:mono/diheme cytochrome c family protein
MNRRYTMLGGCAVVALALIAVWQARTPDQQTPIQTTAGGAIVAVLSRPVEGNAAIGKQIFDSACAACHGANAAGTDGLAPPLVHKIYEPSHHGDEAFQRAASLGVKSHHWPFGNMPPVQGLTRGDVSMIVTYIRELQRANGIL